MNKKFSESLFWDHKILTWDKSRYENQLFKKNPISERMFEALKIMSPYLKNRTVLELGCGTGRIIEPLFEQGISSYVGVDFSEVAISEAKSRAKNIGVSDKCVFHIQEASLPIHQNVDIIFSLGLLDWLKGEDQKKIAETYKDNLFLHSFSRRESSFSQFLHRSYVFLYYGHKNKSYVPSYEYSQAMRSRFGEFSKHKINLTGTSAMSFCSFIHNFENR